MFLFTVDEEYRPVKRVMWRDFSISYLSNATVILRPVYLEKEPMDELAPELPACRP